MQWLDRNRKFIDFTLASLMRRKGKNLSLLLVYSLVVFILSSVIFFSQAIRHEAKEVLQSAPQLVVQRMVVGRYDLMPETYIDKILGHPRRGQSQEQAVGVLLSSGLPGQLHVHGRS
jgi:hypothetical protein